MKTFKQFAESPTMSTTSGIAGLPPDDPPVNPKKKKKYKILSRSYIEVNGKRKRVKGRNSMYEASGGGIARFWVRVKKHSSKRFGTG